MISSFLFSLVLLSTPTLQTYEPNPQATLKHILPKWNINSVNKDTSAQLLEYREAHPELYGITVSPGTDYTLYAEFATMDRIYLVYSDDMRNYWLKIITEAASEMEVFVMTGESGQAAAVQSILDANVEAGLLANITVMDFYPLDHYIYTQPAYNSGIDAIWTVDFGPFYLLDAAGNMVINDAKYYPDRINDDSVPTKLGDMAGIPVYRSDIYIEGGNLISDGVGNCYTTTVVQQYNTKYSVSELETAMAENLGCKNVVWLTPQQDEGTGHIDMFFVLADAHTAIVAEYTTAQDSINKNVLDQNVALLESTLAGDGSPITVYRIPMPDPDSNSWGRVWRTYTNGLRINDKYLIPTYDDETTNEADAISVLEMALPGVTVVAVPSDVIIGFGGAVHCTTRTRPVGTPVVLTEDPAYQCDGHSQCDDCTDECAIDQTGCEVDGSRYVCGNFDEDTCLDKLILPCPSSAPCDGGMCEGFDCEDECMPRELACEDNSTSWICGEAGDADPCLDKIYSDCAMNRECNAGICTGSGNQCGDIDYDGECQGTYSVYCDDGTLIAYDCADYGQVCGYVEGDDWYDCVPAASCEDECEIAETQCGDTENEIEYCAEVFDGDTCLEWRSETCETDNICSDGSCIPDGCQDECLIDAIECSDATSLRTCVADTETECTVWSSQECDLGCDQDAQTPACTVESSDGGDDGCGCSTPGKAPNSSNLPFILMMIGATFFITRRKFK
jgi:agmatine/peptidylarginine deiminase